MPRNPGPYCRWIEAWNGNLDLIPGPLLWVRYPSGAQDRAT
jgi:hypothetical protein